MTFIMCLLPSSINYVQKMTFLHFVLSLIVSLNCHSFCSRSFQGLYELCEYENYNT